MTYSPTKQPKAGSLMRAAGSRAMLRRRCSRAGCDRRALSGEEVNTIYKKDTQSSVFYKNGDGSAEPKNGLNERNVSLLTDCSASGTFFDEVKALHCFQRK